MCSVMNSRSSKIRLPSKGPSHHKSTSSQSSNANTMISDNGNSCFNIFNYQVLEQ